MLTDLQRDILIKSAEGIQEGMWCRGQWFAKEIDNAYDAIEDCASSSPRELIFDDDGQLVIDQEQLLSIASQYRCVEGEIAYRTALQHGTYDDYLAIEDAVLTSVVETCDYCKTRSSEMRRTISLYEHNDNCMEGYDAFTAGQEWSEIFRSLL